MARGKLREHPQFKRDFPETVEIKLEQNYRSTTTILEAANGIIAGAEDGTIPHARSLEDSDSDIRLIEGERRLFYVAITHKLVITSCLPTAVSRVKPTALSLPFSPKSRAI
jgi:superfamily I DNA/RNA helicase